MVADIGDEVERWSASRHEAAAQFLRFTLEILVGIKGGGGPTLPPVAADVFQLGFDDPQRLVLQYAQVSVCAFQGGGREYILRASNIDGKQVCAACE